MKKSELRQIIKEEIASMSAGVGEQYASKNIIKKKKIGEEVTSHEAGYSKNNDNLNAMRQAYYAITDNINGLLDSIYEIDSDYRFTKEVEGKPFDIQREEEIWTKVARLIDSSRIGTYL